MWSCSKSTNKNLYSFKYIRNPMNQTVTKSKYMNTPSYNIVVLIFFHVLPNKFMSISKDEIMDMEFGSCPEHICFCAKLSSSTHSNYFNLYCVNIVVLEVCKINNYFFETIIRSSIQHYNLMSLRSISNVADINSSKFKKF